MSSKVSICAIVFTSAYHLTLHDLCRLLHNTPTVQHIVEHSDSCSGDGRTWLAIYGGIDPPIAVMYLVDKFVSFVADLLDFVYVRPLPGLHGLGNATWPRLVLCGHLRRELRYAGMDAYIRSFTAFAQIAHYHHNR